MKKSFVLISCLILGLFGLWQIKLNVFAETSGSSPESSSTSRLKTLSDALIVLGVGSTGSGAWGDWGTMWNRIYSVSSIDYSLQKNATEDDYFGVYKAEESIWINETDGTVGATGLSSGEIKKDTRTGLIWSAASSATYTNSFTDLTDGTRPTNGNSVLFCNGLNTATYGGKTTWYLPTQKELMQAYIDGIYSQDTAFGTTGGFWSSSESSNSSDAWLVYLRTGSTGINAKGFGYNVRCVRRD